MDEFTPAPSRESPNEVRQRWREQTDTFGRVHDVILGIRTSTAASDVAEIADCSENAAKKHLDRLTEMGIVRADRESHPIQYARNDGYLEFQEANRIARELTVEEIIGRVRDLEAERDAYEERFGTSDPSTVSVFDHDDRRKSISEGSDREDNHEAIHDRMEAIGEWQGIIRDIRLYEVARQLTQNDGHLIPA